jgi:formate C-acetyltransferase
MIKAFRENLRADMQAHVEKEPRKYDKNRQRKLFVLDSLLLSDSASECRYACDGDATYELLNLFCPGIATVGDSLMALDRLVFKEKRYSYKEFVKILKEDFSDADELREEIVSYSGFGNDTELDAYTVLAGNVFLDAVDALVLKENFYAMGGFYSLERENATCSDLGATPNGRKSGTPFSENQSPTYGTDKKGITALFNSLSKLPFDRAATGGLNITFAQRQRPEILEALITSYFEIGGLHVGMSIINREILLDAMEHPERYASLTVRLYGFSEYFVSLPKWQQIAILNRTELCN